MPRIHIDGVAHEVTAGKNLLQSCLELGLDLPYFCWHPALGSVGACRQCAVVQHANADDPHGRVVMGCMTPVTDGAIFSLRGDKAARFRAAVVESLMLNHPHDCPVCAEGGECHLQDMTVMVGHRDRRYRGRKNTHRNQDLGPLIHHEMNRCITCYRCTRYYNDYAGGTDLAALAAHDHIYFGRHEDGTLESPFAGNLVEVCPTGVFTDKALVHEYTRKWDLQSAPSVCVGCGLGCNTLPGERYGKLKRIHNRYHGEVNGYFLCDRGRFGGQFANSDRRLDHPGVRGDDGRFAAIAPDRALQLAAEYCRDKRVAGIGSPRASLEANHCLRELVGAANFYTGLGDGEQPLVQRALAHLATTPARNASLRDVEGADAVLVLGEDVTHTAPRLALALRQAVRNRAFALAAELKLEPWQDAAIRNLAQDQRSPLHLVGAGASDLGDVAASSHPLAAADQVLFADRVLAAVLNGTLHKTAAGATAAGAIHNTAAGATHNTAAGAIHNTAAGAEAVAADLLAAERPLVVVGIAGHNGALLDRAAAIAAALANRWNQNGNGIVGVSGSENAGGNGSGTGGLGGAGAMLSVCLPECNSLGVAMLVQSASNSPAPDGSASGNATTNGSAQGNSAPEQPNSLAQLLVRAKAGAIDTLIILENDLHRRADAALVEQLRQAVPTLIGLDCVETPTLDHCDLVLSAAAFTEGEATLVSAEGRAQRSYPVHPPAANRRESWRWLRDIQRVRDGAAAGQLEPEFFDDITADIAAAHPLLRQLTEAAPDHHWRRAGLKVPRQPHRYSGRTAMRADVSVHEPQQAADPDTPLAYTMEGAGGTDRPGALLPYVWAPGWNSNQSLHKFQGEVGGSLRGGSAGVRLLDGPQHGAAARGTAQDSAHSAAQDADQSAARDTTHGIAQFNITPLPSPAPFAARPDEWQLHPIHRVFGSDELSQLCPRMAARASAPFISLNPADAARLGVTAGDGVRIEGLGDFEARVDPLMPAGCAGYSAGFQGGPPLWPGQWATLGKSPNWQPPQTQHQTQPQVIAKDAGVPQ